MLRTSRQLRTILAAAAALVASGCTAVIPVPTTVDVAGMPNPEVALQKSMQHVDAEMSQLGGLSRPTPSLSPVLPSPLERMVDFRWSGPLDAGVARLAQSVGFTFYTTKPPVEPGVSVSVDLHGMTALDAFRALGERAGTSATVEVDPVHHSVQVTHHA